MTSVEPNSPNRRLAAVMFLDMVRYSALMSENESQAITNLKDLKKILHSAVSSFEGRIVKSLGDGFLLDFPTALSAVSCSKHILAALDTHNHVRPYREHIDVRIAIQLGDVVEEKGDLFGDAVNIAARLQPLCDTNSIIMTDMVYVQVCNQIVLKGAHTPPRKLKNIPNRMRVFQTVPEGVNFAWWSLKKRGWMAAAAMALVILGLLSTGILYLEKRLAEAKPRIGLLYIQAQNPKLEPIARSMEVEINIKFASLESIHWVERAALLGMFRQEGITDLTQIQEMEGKAFHIEKQSGLYYALYGGVEKIRKNRWRLSMKVVDTKSMVCIKVLTVSGPDVPSIISLMKFRLQSWLDKNS
jgi:class 3 adenylate cyclase